MALKNCILYLGVLLGLAPTTFGEMSAISSRVETLDTTSMLLQFQHFLLLNSPPHQLYLLYDEHFSDITQTLKFYSESWKDCTVMEYMAGLTHLKSALTSTLKITNTNRRHIVVTCSTENIINVFDMISENNLEQPSYWWIIISSDEGVIQQLQAVLREGSMVLVVYLSKLNNYKMLSSYIDTDGQVSFRLKGFWSPDSETTLTEPLFESLEDHYADFAGRQLIVTANDNRPFFGLTITEDGRTLSDSGIDNSLMDAMGRALNFTYKVMRPSDGKWGGKLSDGTIIGMFSELNQRNAHIAICEITITGNRESVSDFTTPYYQEALTMVSTAPSEKNRAFAVLSPFTFNVWICIAIAILSIGPILSIETWFMKTFLRIDTTEYNINDFAFNMFRSFVIQTNLITGKHWSHRLTFFFWYLFCLNVLAFYSGNLTAVLVTPTFGKPIDYLTDLEKAVEDGFTIATVSDSAFEALFREAEEGIYKEVWQLFNPEESFFTSPADGYSHILSNNLVLVNGQMNSKIQGMRNGPDKYHYSKQTFYPQSYGIACFPGSPFRIKFNQMISYMTEGGLVRNWANEQLTKVALTRDRSQDGKKGGPQAITLKHLQAAFFLLVLGFLISILSLGIEAAFWEVKPNKIF